MSSPAFGRIIRRETHSPRTVAMIVAVVLLIIALAFVGVEIVLYLLAQPALLVGPGVALKWIIGLPGQPAGLAIVGGVVLAIVGLVFLILGIAPGRLPKHEMSLDGRALIVDNGVIASSLAQRISEETGIARDDITVGVAHRSVDVTVRSGFGDPHDAAPVRQVLERELASYSLIPSVRPRVRVVTPREGDENR